MGNTLKFVIIAALISLSFAAPAINKKNEDDGDKRVMNFGRFPVAISELVHSALGHTAIKDGEDNEGLSINDEDGDEEDGDSEGHRRGDNDNAGGAAGADGEGGEVERGQCGGGCCGETGRARAWQEAE